MSWLLFALIIGFGVACAMATESAERARLNKLLDRPCAGMRWHRRFPSVPHDDIRTFLKLFTNAFAIAEIHYSKFQPDDRPLAIYESRYVPYLTLDDHMEFESFTMAFQDAYGIDLATGWREDITLAELFAMTIQKSGSHKSAK